MKNLKLLSLIITLLVFAACSSDDDAPAPVNEEELITTVKVTLTPTTGGLATITLESVDTDGDDGPAAAVNNVSGNLISGETYNATVEFLNETENPAEDITEEVEDEDDEHQVFFTAGGGINIVTAYANFDGDGNPLGTEFTATPGASGSGTFTITLRHEPTKPNTGLGDAGGSTDAERTFNVTIN